MGGIRTGSVWHQFDQAPLARPRILRALPFGCLVDGFEAFRPDKRNRCRAFPMFVVISRLDALSASMLAIGIASFDGTALRWDKCTMGDVRFMSFSGFFPPPSWDACRRRCMFK